MLFGLPLLFALESVSERVPALREVITVEIINAPRSAVWQHVVTFPELAPPTELVFRAGIAYPVRASIEGAGVGAIRRCEFSTGAFVEPITTWDAPAKLAFSVTAQPAPLDELSPWGQINPPHLDHYLRSERGSFVLEELEGGRTKLIGTTWYRNYLWPTSYWYQWSDWLIHKIHRRVLKHIERLAENQKQALDSAIDVKDYDMSSCSADRLQNVFAGIIVVCLLSCCLLLIVASLLNLNTHHGFYWIPRSLLLVGVIAGIITCINGAGILLFKQHR